MAAKTSKYLGLPHYDAANMRWPRLLTDYNFNTRHQGKTDPYLLLPSHHDAVGKSTALWLKMAALLCQNETKRHCTTAIGERYDRWYIKRPVRFGGCDIPKTRRTHRPHPHRTKRTPLLVQTPEARQNPLLKNAPSTKIYGTHEVMSTSSKKHRDASDVWRQQRFHAHISTST